MFENTGKKLLELVKLITIIEMVVTGFSGLIMSFGIMRYSGSFGLVIMLITAVIVCAEYIHALFFIGICEMMEDVHTIKNKYCDNEIISNKTTTSKSALKEEFVNDVSNVNQAVNSNVNINQITENNVETKKTETSEMVVCKYCGKQYRFNQFGCIYCHKK